MALFIGRIPKSMSTRELEGIFTKYGKITRLDVKTDFGFVEFEDKRDAEDALKEVNGKDLVVEWAKNGGKRPNENECFNCGREEEETMTVVIVVVKTEKIPLAEKTEDMTVTEESVAEMIVSEAQKRTAVSATRCSLMQIKYIYILFRCMSHHSLYPQQKERKKKHRNTQVYSDRRGPSLLFSLSGNSCGSSFRELLPLLGCRFRGDRERRCSLLGDARRCVSFLGPNRLRILPVLRSCCCCSDDRSRR
ncbi:hypothetical protein BX666DRAFT_1476437 [Dichotomocladium elegans]|nr:hypothetical protein BX666DRAFT_1476437 [Dichotomocladium elegans]